LRPLKSNIRKYCETKKDLSKGESQLGTHTLRKSAYLFATFGTSINKFNGHSVSDGSSTVQRGCAEIQYANVLKAARHTTVQNAILYFRDSSTKWSAIQREQHPHLNKVGIWELIYIDDPKSFQSISAASHYYKKNIAVLVEYYMSIKYKIPEDGTITVLQVIEPSTNAVGRLLQRFKVECNPTLYNEFKENSRRSGSGH
jgi:hypothetical protein